MRKPSFIKIPAFAIAVSSGYSLDLKQYLPPNKAVKEIKIRHVTGSLSGGSSGTYTANSIFSGIALIINGKSFYAGAIDGDEHRECMKLFVEHALPAEQFDFVFRDALMSKDAGLVSLTLNLTTDSISNIQGGDRTTYSSATCEITLVCEEGSGSKQQVIMDRYTKDTDNGTGEKLLDVVLPMESTVQNLIIITVDNGTWADSIDVAQGISLTADGEMIAELGWTELKNMWAHVHKTATVVTGVGFIKILRKISALRFAYTISSAPTDLITKVFIVKEWQY